MSEWLDPARPVPDVRTPLPGPEGKAVIRDAIATGRPFVAPNLAHLLHSYHLGSLHLQNHYLKELRCYLHISECLQFLHLLNH